MEEAIIKNMYIYKHKSPWFEKAIETTLEFNKSDTIVSEPIHISFSKKFLPSKINASLKVKSTKYSSETIYNKDHAHVLMYVTMSDIVCFSDKYYIQVEYFKRYSEFQDIISNHVLIYEFSKLPTSSLITFHYKYPFYKYGRRIDFRHKLDEECSFWELYPIDCK